MTPVRAPQSVDIGIIISNVGVRMLGIQYLIIFPGKGGVRIIE